MENEIKRLEKNKSVTIVVMLVIMLAIVLSACTVLSGGDTEYVAVSYTHLDVYKRQVLRRSRI